MRNNNSRRELRREQAQMERVARFWAAFGSRLVDAGFAGAASLLVKAFLAPTAGAAILDVLASFATFIFFTLGGYYAFTRGGAPGPD
jgi:hypothetical protein